MREGTDDDVASFFFFFDLDLDLLRLLLSSLSLSPPFTLRKRDRNLLVLFLGRVITRICFSFLCFASRIKKRGLN